MFKWFKQYFISRKWLGRADDLEVRGHLMPPSWDCDVRCEILMKEMVASGLRLGRDWVVVWCTHRLTTQRHMFIELFGTNSKYFNGYDRINGYVIDPTPTPLASLTKFKKGLYTPKGEDYYG